MAERARDTHNVVHAEEVLRIGLAQSHVATTRASSKNRTCMREKAGEKQTH